MINIATIPVSKIMETNVIKVQMGYSIKKTIETFKIHNISCALVEKDNKLIGIVSEHDLLIQVASRKLEDSISFVTTTITLNPEHTLKEALVLFYSKKLKHVPVVDKNNIIMGIISRIDILNTFLWDPEKPF